MSDDRRITHSSGNVFADLGVRDPEDAMARAQLLRRIKVIIEESGMTQSEAARALGIDQPQVSKLMHGKLSIFSMDRLIHFLKALDRDVEIVVKPKTWFTRRSVKLDSLSRQQAQHCQVRLNHV